MGNDPIADPGIDIAAAERKAPQLVTFREVAEYLDCTPAHVCSLASKGVGGRKLECVTIGKRGLRTTWDAVKRFSEWCAEYRKAQAGKQRKKRRGDAEAAPVAPSAH